jgi:DNA polymerase III delta subunit
MNAYKKWTFEEDEMLELHFCEKKSIAQLCSLFGRNRGAIKSRIEKLELKIKYGS